MVTTSVRRHLLELRAALRVVAAVLVTLLLVTVPAGRPRPERPATPVAGARSLVVLVHGFGAGPGCFDAMLPALGGPGVAVVTHRYSWTTRVGELGEQLADEVTDLARRSGARSVTLVGHSLGGVVVASSLPRLDGLVSRVVTVAAPLRGTRWARLFPVGAVRDLRVGSPALQALAAAPRPRAPWTAVASRADTIVAVESATPEAAEAVVVDGVGHCGLLRDADVIARTAALARHTSRRSARTSARVVLPARPVPAIPALSLVA
ncbi:esterase/lipase family protein [Actinomycetospora straminea]|uniref:AB hydrolase-1 domain-containing protein n=1 Tax=Actinomycetospora straminea TaxID=663607 RepID=A0ABP9DYE7_9PSEU|nr:alpha/beta fold hydrolase [Actinomycetospora straminea]MDD7934116.1 alpha/beta fold hydrolase [Actinomycetospora straminea]